MINWTLIYFGLALVCGLLGFSGMAGSYGVVVEVSFVGFIVLAVITAVKESTPPFSW